MFLTENWSSLEDSGTLWKCEQEVVYCYFSQIIKGDLCKPEYNKKSKTCLTTGCFTANGPLNKQEFISAGKDRIQLALSNKKSVVVHRAGILGWSEVCKVKCEKAIDKKSCW